MSNYVSTIECLKQRVNEMLTERQAISHRGHSGEPSPIWEDSISVFSYIMNLSPADLYNIRFHTGLINGGSWEYWHPYPKPDPAQVARNIGYIDAVKNIPREYWLSEPPTPHIPRPLGVDYQGHIINANVVRYQTVVSNLLFAGAFRTIEEASQKQIIVEVGSGYGGLAHGISKILENKATYILIDFPEMLLFPGAFLAVNNPDKAIYIYNRETFVPGFFLDEIFKFDFVLIPNYVLNELRAIQEVAVLINTQSFQEMTEDQIREYLSLFKDKIRCCVYSDNMDRHPYNVSKFSLPSLLEEYFTLYPNRNLYQELSYGVDPFSYGNYKRFFGFPKGEWAQPDGKNDLNKMLVWGTKTMAEARRRNKVKKAFYSIPFLLPFLKASHRKLLSILR